MNRDLFDIPHHANLFALIYKAAVDLYGENGAKAADEGTKLYGQQRGARMAQRAMKDGAPLTMENYLKERKYQPLPQDLVAKGRSGGCQRDQ